MRYRYLLLLLSVVLILLLTISACGRKGEPRPPEKITNNQVIMEGQGSRGMGQGRADFEFPMTLAPGPLTLSFVI